MHICKTQIASEIASANSDFAKNPVSVYFVPLPCNTVVDHQEGRHSGKEITHTEIITLLRYRQVLACRVLDHLDF